MTWWFWYKALEWTISLAMLPVILRRRMQPATALAWLAVIFFAPLLGVVVYFLVGTEVLGRRRRRLHREVVRRRGRAGPFAAASETIGTTASRSPAPGEGEGGADGCAIRLQAERIFGMPAVSGNDVVLVGARRPVGRASPGRAEGCEGDTFIDGLIADINAARRHVHMIFYIFEPDETGHRVTEALCAAAARGVKCRVLADGAGSRALFKRHGPAGRLRDCGVAIHPALPVSPFRRRLARLDLRNHRKVAIFDGRVAWTGSHNVIDSDFTPGKGLECIDLSARLTGPVVTQLQVVFAEDWAFETGEMLEAGEIFSDGPAAGVTPVQTVPSGPDEQSRSFQHVILAATNDARRRLILTTPYFVPDEPMMQSLCLAAARDVRVQIVVTERSDYALVTAAGRAYFDRLLRWGVEIFLYRPGLLHAKTLTVDESFSLLGTANLDIRSFYLNFELNLLLYGAEITGQLRAIQQGYIEQSSQLDAESWRRRPAPQRYRDDAAALLSPLL